MTWVAAFHIGIMMLMIWLFTVWGRVMEWKYPVEIVITNPKLFRAAGLVEAAATL